MQSYKLRFDNAAGQSLSARLDLPIDGAPVAYALFAHCFTCSKNLRAIGNIAEALTLRGIAVFRFDFTGLGESAGEFAETNFTSNVEDLVAAAGFLARQGNAPAILIGHSLGGAAVLQAASRIPSAVAVATIGAPSEPAHVLNLIGDDQAEIRDRGEARVTLSGASFTIRRQFIEDLEARAMRQTVRHLRKALLVLHSPVDEIVGIENAAMIFEAAVHPKSFISLDHADHLLTRQEDSYYVGQMIAAWAAKYLATAERAAAEAEERKPTPDARVVVRNDAGSLRAEIMAGRHALVVDEPVSVGGTDCGPTPYDLIAASLGSCTAITLRLYAQRKDWPLDSVVVRLKHRKAHVEDCIQCEQPGAKIDHLDREIELAGPLDEAQRKRLMEIADHCPVHKTLEAGIRVITTEAPVHAQESGLPYEAAE
jgi:putative redox protein